MAKKSKGGNRPNRQNRAAKQEAKEEKSQERAKKELEAESVKMETREGKKDILQELNQNLEGILDFKKEDIIKAIKATEDNLNKDFNDLIDGLEDKIKRNDNKINGLEDKIKRNDNKINGLEDKIVEKNKEIIKSIVQRSTNKAAEFVIKTVQNNVENNEKDIINNIRSKSDLIRSDQNEMTSKINNISKVAEEWRDYDETVLGKLSKINELIQGLSNKDVIISKEIPPINADEEDIINLVRYSQKISEQLGYAARQLVRKREFFESQKQGNINEQEIVKQKLAKKYEEGVNKGKFEVIKTLLSAFDGVDSIKDSDNNYVSAMWNQLKEIGVKIDGDYEKGKEIDLLETNIEGMLGIYSGLDGAGKYKVIKTGIVFNGEIIVKAKFDKIDESKDEEVDLEAESKKNTESIDNKKQKETVDNTFEEAKDENNNTDEGKENLEK